MAAHFDLSDTTAPSYFKSSFARSMANESKSLELTVSPPPMEEAVLEKPQVVVKPSPRRSVPSLPTYEAIRESYRRPRTNDVIKFWKLKQESVNKGTENGWSSPPSPSDESKDDEILRLRKECQGLMESNRRLQSTGGSNLPVDLSLLQSQVDTLQWQLKQAESNRQMYRAVMEQVSKFLERVYKSLESGPPQHVKNGPRAKHRVPRSRSVHTVVSNGSTGTQSRASSPSAASSASSATASSVHRANSISQISHDNYLTWRSSRCTSAASEDVIPLDRLSQEAFRLLRTVQSLLSTREPDLARVTSDSSDHHTDSTSMGSCSSLLEKGVVTSNGGQGETTPQLSVGSAEDESGFSSMSSFHDHPATTKPHTKYPAPQPPHSDSNQGMNGDSKPEGRRGSGWETPRRVCEPQSQLLRTESHRDPVMRTESHRDSSLSRTESHREPMGPSHRANELGLPLVDPAEYRHRRWSSVPVPDQASPSLTVLWV